MFLSKNSMAASDQISKAGSGGSKASFELDLKKPVANKLTSSQGTKQGENEVSRRLSLLFLPPKHEELGGKADQTSETARLLGDSSRGSVPVVVGKLNNNAESKPETSGPQKPHHNSAPQKPPHGGATQKSPHNSAPQKPPHGSATQKSPHNSPPQKAPHTSSAPQKLTGPHKEQKTEDEIDKLSILDKIENGKSESESDFAASEDHSGSEVSSNEDEEADHRENKEGDRSSWDDTICSNRSAYFKHYYHKNLSGGGTFTSRSSIAASSHNSLVSLIKERDKSSMAASASPEEKKKKRKEDFGLMALVIFLFLVLVIGISLIYHFYHLHLMELSLFKKLKFHEEGRLLNVYDLEGNMDITAKLGTTMIPFVKPADCTNYLRYIRTLEVEEEVVARQTLTGNKSAVDIVVKKKLRPTDFQFDQETVCLDWTNQARVQIHKAPSSKYSVNCYNVFWSAQIPGLPLQDCMLISSASYGVWWGIGDLTGGAYPLERVEAIPSSLFITGQLGEHPWGRILRRAYVSSTGGLLILPDDLPVSVSATSEKLCIAANLSQQMENSMIPLTLNYTVCSSPNISSSMRYLHHLSGVVNNGFQSHSKALLEVNKERILQRIEHPMWVPHLQPDLQKFNADAILEYVDKILASNESTWGHILLPLMWQKRPGDFTFDSQRFPDPKNFTKLVRRKGFDLALTISPLVSTDTKTFSNGTKEGLWVQQKGSALPILVHYNQVIAGAMIDFTNTRAVDWLVSKLRNLRDTYEIDKFYLYPPDSNSIPIFHEFNQHILNPDLALQPFISAVSKVSAPVSTEGAILPPPLPTFVTVGREESGWRSLASLIPRILTLTMLGYPLIDAGVIGGNSDRPGNIPEDELYIRWCQAVAFLPAFQMNTLSEFYAEDTREIVSKYFDKRETLVIPRFKLLLEETLVNNTSLISPLALKYPDDVAAAAVGDEWLIGDDLLVAPVLEEGKTSRNIYIPDGLWEGQLDGRLKRGPGWIYNYKVPLTDTAHFIKRHYSSLRS